jgi:hypothetical protein
MSFLRHSVSVSFVSLYLEMTRNTLIIIFTLCIPAYLSAQNEAGKFKYVDFGFAVGQYQGSVTLSGMNDWHFGMKKKFYVGLGARFTSYLGADKNYITAPAKLTSGKTGPSVLFVENIQENIDTLIMKYPQVNAVNLLVNLGYQFNNKLSIGFNIDFVGFSFGGTKNSNYFSTNNGVKSGKMISATPTLFNLLLISDNDLGSLNSELYARYQIKQKWGLKAGLQFLFTEYKTGSEVQQYPESNDRFRLKSLMISIGLSRRF